MGARAPPYRVAGPDPMPGLVKQWPVHRQWLCRWATHGRRAPGAGRSDGLAAYSRRRDDQYRGTRPVRNSANPAWARHVTQLELTGQRGNPFRVSWPCQGREEEGVCCPWRLGGDPPVAPAGGVVDQDDHAVRGLSIPEDVAGGVGLDVPPRYERRPAQSIMDAF